MQCALVLQVYLVGDPVQLPATVISGRALEQGYDVSLFKRLQVSTLLIKRVLMLVALVSQ